MALGYFPAMTIFLLLETAKITGGATTKPTTSPPTTSKPRPFASVADTTSGTETTTPATETNRYSPSSIALLSKTTSPWSTVGESLTTNYLGTTPSPSSPEASIPAGTSDVPVASSSLAVTSISSTGFGGPSSEGTTHPPETTMLVISSTTQEMSSSLPSPTSQDKRTSEGLLTSTAEEMSSSPPSPTSQDKRTSEGLLTSTAEEMSSSPPSPTSRDKRTSEGLLTSTAEEMSSSPPSPTSQDKRTSEGLLTSTAEEMSSSPPSPTSQDKRTSEGLLTSTAEEMSSSPPSPTSQDKKTSEGPSTIISIMTQEESTSEKHLSSPPFTMNTSPMLVPLPTPTVATSIPLSASSGVGDTTGSSEATTSSEAEITSWWPGSAHSTTSTSTAEEVNSSPRSPTTLDKGTSEGLLTSNAVNSSPHSPTSQDKRTSEGLLISTAEEVSSSPHSPTPLDKRISEGVSTSTTEEVSSSPRSPTWFLLTSTLVTSTPTSVISGVGDTTSSSEVTTGSEVEITGWRPGTYVSSTSSSVTQDRSTLNVTSTGLLSSNSGRTSFRLSAPSSTNPTSECPATTLKILSSTPTSSSASTSLPKTPGEATTEITTLPSTSVPTSEPRPSTSVPDTTGVTGTIPTAGETMGSLPSSVAFVSNVTSPWSTLGETSLHGRATTLPSPSSPDASIPAGTQGVSPASTSLEMTSISTTGFGGPSEEGTIYPAESTMPFISSTTEEMSSSSRSPTPQGKRTSEGLSTSTAEEMSSSPRSPTWFLLASTLVTYTPTSANSGVGDTTSSSEVTTGSEVEITKWRPGITPSSTSSSVTQYRSTPKFTSAGHMSSNPGKSSLGPSPPSSTNPTSEYPATSFKVLSSTPISSSASTSLPKTPAGTRFILSVRFSTQLNIRDPSVAHAVRKWLNEELQARFPVGSFSLTWIG
ncbi:mucin-2-like [Ahaetulla prasina]|uniref:mucin-2-like n=1 Tax=Ahaetulla prasina TaxID=499056 RepID=UPI0026481EBA|nr:mucin-2-like [Ahaetulla prasina]